MEVRSFLGVAQYWRKFIANFSSIVAPLHALTSVKKVFHWGDMQQKTFDVLNQNINSAPILALPDLRQPFEIQTDASDYAMGAVFMQHGKPISFHYEIFHGAMTNYPTNYKELYALVQRVNKWKHYLMGNRPLSILMISHCSTYNHSQSCSNQEISDGWDFYNNFIWLSGTKRDSTIR